jgi:hypothetical protein
MIMQKNWRKTHTHTHTYTHVIVYVLIFSFFNNYYLFHIFSKFKKKLNFIRKYFSKMYMLWIYILKNYLIWLKIQLKLAISNNSIVVFWRFFLKTIFIFLIFCPNEKKIISFHILFPKISPHINFWRKEKSINLTTNVFEFCYLIHFNNKFWRKKNFQIT